jgi:hypothetical protein
MLLWGGSHPPRHPKIADLKVAGTVHQQVGWLNVSVQHIRRVDELKSSAKLVHKVPPMLFRQRLLRMDDPGSKRVESVSEKSQAGEVPSACKVGLK